MLSIVYPTRLVSLAVLTLVCLLSGTGIVLAAPLPGTAWTVSMAAQPTNLPVTTYAYNEPKDQYVLLLTNTGSLPSSGTITVTDVLPAGTSLGSEKISSPGWTCPVAHGATVITCETSESVQPLRQSAPITIPLAVPAAGTLVNEVTVAGGGAPVANARLSTLSGAPVAFSVLDFTSQTSDVSGAPDTQAGDRPFALTTTLDFPQFETAGSPEHAVQVPKSMEIDLPVGLVGNPQALSQCTMVEVFSLTCPAGSRAGTFTVNFGQGLAGGEGSIYNVIPEAGYPAEFALYDKRIGKPVFMYVSLRPAPDYGIHISVPNIPFAAEAANLGVTFFGDPQGADGTGASPLLFFTNPSDCSGAPLITKIRVDSYEEPNHWVQRETQAEPVAGCDHLQFEPAFTFTPETTQADEPTGATFDLQVPQSQSTSLESLATADLKDVKVTLPRGVSVNPAAADGLGACPANGPGGFNMEGPEAQAPDSVGTLSPVSGHCPLDSQVGTVEAETPLLPPHALTGHLYVAEPQCGGEGQPACTNADAQDGKLFGLDLQLEGEGVVVKLHGSVSANPSDGQLTATFDNNPQLPVSDIKLHLTGGPRAPLANPATCGEALTTSDLTPWSSPETPDAHPVSAFGVSGCEGNPFAPAFGAGTTSTSAGAYTDFIATFTRPDRQQNLDAIQVTTPPGLLGMLSHVALCGEPQAAQGTCSESSRIGTATAGAGAGSHPFWVNGPVFLTGPYKGAPFGLSIAIPAKAGPFNLGTVVVRSAITIDPVTSALTVTSDPLPQILDGVPLRVQSVNVTVDKPAFMFNPTNCTGKQVTGTLASAQGATSHVASSFAAGGCENLPFKPKFTASTKAKTSKANGASLTVKVASGMGQANIARVDVQLPKALPARLTTLQKACTEAQFNANPAGCPAASMIGVAKAITPVLNVPLVGPAILVSHGGAAFPDVEFILQGQGVTIDLDGKTQIKKGVTYSRFETVPDAPITSFETVLPQGPHSVLAANLPVKARGSLCGSKLVLPTTLVGQNGAVISQSTKLAVSGCPRARVASKRKTKRGKR